MNVCGGSVIIFGIVSDVSPFAQVAIADLNVGYKIKETFRLGVGGITVLEKEPDFDLNGYPYILYAFAKFSIYFGQKE